eukprot:Sdes_comp21411_c0_seq1m20043
MSNNNFYNQQPGGTFQYQQVPVAPPTYQDSFSHPPPGQYANSNPPQGYTPQSQGMAPKHLADFDDKSVRLGFLRKVYGILSLQLFVTFGISCIFLFQEDVKYYVQHSPGVLILAFVSTFVCLIVLACGGDIRKKSPYNIIFLGIFTLCEGYLIGAISTFYSANEVAVALGLTMITVLAVTIFACQTKIDFTLCGGFLFCALFMFILAGFFMMFFPSHTANLIYSIIGALIFVFYLLYDTQLMLGGDHSVAISPEEYIFAALNLYLDIINLFLYLLRILRELDR